MSNRSIEVQPLGPSSSRDPQVHGNREAIQSRVHGLVGTEMRAADAPPRFGAVGDAGRPAVEAVNPAMEQAKDLIRDIKESASSLRGNGLEHRVQDFRDRFPIWGNIRSHRLATREGEQIDSMHESMRALRELVARSGLPLDLDRLEQLVFGVSKPAGISKFLGSVFTGFREFHRGWTADTLENISVEAGKLLRPARAA